MLRTVQFACTLPKAEADALNAESGRIYTDMLVRHYRLYRKQSVWLAPKNGERVEDTLGGPTTLHAHSRDAAQQGFYKACKTAKACKQVGLERSTRIIGSAGGPPSGKTAASAGMGKHCSWRGRVGWLRFLCRCRPLSSSFPPLPCWKHGWCGTGPPGITPGIWWLRMD